MRSAAHAMGLRFRVHRRDLPGTPDLVLPKHRTVRPLPPGSIPTFIGTA
jgi:G:T-mismatch repair DNA endonuclease (very short patch repair protein)